MRSSACQESLGIFATEWNHGPDASVLGGSNNLATYPGATRTLTRVPQLSGDLGAAIRRIPSVSGVF